MAGLPVTSFAAGVAAIGLVALSVPVSLRRFKLKATSGDAGDEGLRRRIRAQGNFIEYTPMGLIILALLEAAAAHPAMLWVLAVLLIIGRTLHAAGMLTDSQALRALGMAATFATLLGGAGVLLARVAFT